MSASQSLRPLRALLAISFVSLGNPVWANPESDPSVDDETYETTVKTRREPETTLEGRSTYQTSRNQMEERQVRSTPDALRYTPGVYVQQTSHGQGSPFIRGLTGRRTLLLFDGLRINHALFRQGPNQYLHTVDTQIIERLEVSRGSAGVELGSGAMGGAVLIHPRQPTIDTSRAAVHIQPTVRYGYDSATAEQGGRFQIDSQLGTATGLLTGVGYRDVGRLQAGGAVAGLRPWASEEERLRWEVPRFESDGRTMMGTGFRELTADVRLVHHLGTADRLTVAGYLYRQFDAPRTDQCPPPEAPDSWCLQYAEQFRTHVYGRAELRPEWTFLDGVVGSVGVQRQHERRENTQIFSNFGVDDINVLSMRLRAQSKSIPVADGVSWSVHYGADGSWEDVASRGWAVLDFSRTLPDSQTRVISHRPRGQYVDDSRYLQGGSWASGRLHLGHGLSLRAGLRAAAASAFAPADSASDTPGVDRTWLETVWQTGAQWQALPSLTLMANLEQGFRPPNLDDLTARQITGQGFQLDNPDLDPERSLTAELGARFDYPRWKAQAWVYQLVGTDWMERRDSDCPASLERECQAARWAPPVTLVNLPETAIIRGAEIDASLALPLQWLLRTTASWTWGEGTSPLENEPNTMRPLSRIPPTNGTLEARWRHQHWTLGAALRWARSQDRLSFADLNDKRIPPGGTPGYQVVDVRAGWQPWETLRTHLVLANLTDAAYRGHGSSVNGPGRSLVFSAEGSY